MRRVRPGQVWKVGSDLILFVGEANVVIEKGLEVFDYVNLLARCPRVTRGHLTVCREDVVHVIDGEPVRFRDIWTRVS